MSLLMDAAIPWTRDELQLLPDTLPTDTLPTLHRWRPWQFLLPIFSPQLVTAFFYGTLAIPLRSEIPSLERLPCLEVQN